MGFEMKSIGNTTLIIFAFIMSFSALAVVPPDTILSNMEEKYVSTGGIFGKEPDAYWHIVDYYSGSPSDSFYVGLTSASSYENGEYESNMTDHRLVSDTFNTLAGECFLYWRQDLDTSNDSNGGDVAAVEVYDGSTWVEVYGEDSPCDSDHWEKITVEVTAYINPSFRVRFVFNSDGDGLVDHGWYIDDVCIYDPDGYTTDLLNEGFEDGFPTGWGLGDDLPVPGSKNVYGFGPSSETVDSGGKQRENYWRLTNTESHTGSWCIYDDYDIPPGDDWLFTSRLDMTDYIDVQLSFWVRTSDTDPDTLAVYGSRIFGEFELIESLPNNGMVWIEENGFDLVPYLGYDTVYLCLCHTDPNNVAFYVDDFRVWGTAADIFVREDFESGVGGWTVEYPPSSIKHSSLGCIKALYR